MPTQAALRARAYTYIGRVRIRAVRRAFAVRFFWRFLGASATFFSEEWDKITQAVEF